MGGGGGGGVHGCTVSDIPVGIMFWVHPCTYNLLVIHKSVFLKPCKAGETKEAKETLACIIIITYIITINIHCLFERYKKKTSFLCVPFQDGMKQHVTTGHRVIGS